MSKKRQLLLAVLSGFLVALSFPMRFGEFHLPNLGWISFFSLIPLYISIANVSVRRAYLLSFASFTCYFGISLYWTAHATHVFGHISLWLSAILALSLSIMMAAILAMAPLIMRWLSCKKIADELILLPMAFTAIELLRTYIPFGGFPWANISMALFDYPLLIQTADITGFYGIVFFIVWINVFLAQSILYWQQSRFKMLKLKLILTVILIGSVLGYGYFRMNDIQDKIAQADIAKIALVQANIPQDEKWLDQNRYINLKKHAALISDVDLNTIDLVVWPETSFTSVVSPQNNPDPWQMRTFGFHGNPKHTSVFFGNIWKDADNRYYNSSMLIDADGHMIGQYHKSHLTPFGEYMPLKKFFFFLEKLTAPVGDFFEGTNVSPLRAPGFLFGPLICYEDIFPDIARTHVQNNAQVLVNITNNAWFGKTSAPYQQLAMSIFRAVETRRALVRATNTGVSAVIFPDGQLYNQSGLFDSALLIAKVPLLNMKTLFVQFGNSFAYMCVAGLILLALSRIVVLKKT